MAVKRVIFIRPGETDWNRSGRWQGKVAIPLNDLGMAQTRRLAQFIRNVGLHALYSSDLRRAKDTAEILAQASGVQIRYEPRLRERDMGEWQGLTLDEISGWYPQEYKRVQETPHTFQVPGGESRRQVSERVVAVFDDILERGGETLGVISHTTAVRALLANLLQDPEAYNFHFRNISVTTLVREDNSWRISQFDDVTHLEGMPSSVFYEVEEGQHDSNH